MLCFQARILTALLFFAVLMGCQSKGIEKENQKALLHFRLGTSHLKSGQYPLALKELKTAAKLSPQNPGILNNLGLAYYVRKKFKLAEQNFRKSLKADPKYTDARNNLGRVLVEQGRAKEAVTQLLIADKDLEYPYPGRTQGNLGFAYLKLGQLGKAQEALTEALKLNRHDCFALYHLGRASLSKKDYSVASDSFDQVIYKCIDKGYGDSYYFSGFSHLRLGNREKGIARLEESISKFPRGALSARASRELKRAKQESSSTTEGRRN